MLWSRIIVLLTFLAAVWLLLYFFFAFDFQNAGFMEVRSGLVQKIFKRVNLTFQTEAALPLTKAPSFFKQDRATDIAVDKTVYQVEGRDTKDIPLHVHKPENTLSEHNNNVDNVDNVENNVQPAAPRGITLYVHGGGWVAGRAAHFDNVAESLAQHLDRIICVVDYKLSPEYVFPTAAHNVVDVYNWLRTEGAAELGGDPLDIGLMGDSAGGNLCVAASLMLRDEFSVQPSHQVLFYPVLDVSRFDTRSHERFGTNYLISTRVLRQARAMYIGGDMDHVLEESKNTYISVLNATLKGLCPTLIVNPEKDPLTTEGLKFHARLQAAGVTSARYVVQGVMHGFMQPAFGGTFTNVQTRVIKPWLQELQDI